MTAGARRRHLPPISAGALRVMAVASVLLGAALSPPALSVSAVLFGFVLWLWGRKPNRVEHVRSDHRWAGAAALIVIVGTQLYPVGPLPEAFVTYRPILLAMGIGAASVLFVFGSTANGRRAAMLLAGVAALSATILVLSTEWRSPVGIDVYHAHREAGEAISTGVSPYGEAVRFVEGSGLDDEERIVIGYPYPPVSMVAYGGVASFADPRSVSAAAWLVVLAWFGWRASKEETVSGHVTGVFVLLGSFPLWSVVLYAAWTEPLSLALFIGAAALWTGRSQLSALLLGLALASKQYFAFLAPVVLLEREVGRARRAIIVAITISATLAPFLLLDPVAFLESTVGNLAEIPMRPDSQSISGALAVAGVDVVLPDWVWVGVVLVVGALVGRSARSPSQVYAGFALTLGFGFLTGLAFPNYWFLVGGLLATAVVLDSGGVDRTQHPSDVTQPGSRRPAPPGTSAASAV